MNDIFLLVKFFILILFLFLVNCLNYYETKGFNPL